MKWELHRQPKDVIADHEYSIWCDGEPVVLANVIPGEDGVLATIVEILNASPLPSKDRETPL